MVAILIRRICNDIQMKRHKESNDYSSEEEASMPRRAGEAVQKRCSPRQQPPAGSRDLPSAPVTTVITAMSDMPYNKAPSFEQRDEQRSAFSPVHADEGPSTSEAQQQGRSQGASTPVPHGMTSETGSAPLPYQSPIRYYQQQQEDAEGSDVADTDAGHQYAHPHYPRYPYQNPTHDYSRYYDHQTAGQESASPSMSGGQYHHTPYPSYHHHHQEYSHYPSGYSHHYSYYPSAAYSAQYPHQTQEYHSHHQHPYYPERTPPPRRAGQSKPSAVTGSTKGRAPSAMAQGARGSGDGEGLDLSPSHESLDQDYRKPADVSSGGNKYDAPRASIRRASHGRGEDDFDPIPLNQFPAIPALSPATTDAAPHDAFPDAFPGRTTGPQSGPYATSSSPAADAAASDDAARVAPPVPTNLTTPTRRRPPQRTIAPSSSSSGGSDQGGSWERRYNELLEFKRVHSHCEVPQNYAENTSLGTWVNKQRMEHKNRIEGKNSSLNNSRLERLERIGFRWAKRKGQASWDEKFKELKAYKAKFGNCHVPTKYKDNTALGRWVSTQRAEYKKYQEGQAKTSMNADKIRRLESIGFAWFMAL